MPFIYACLLHRLSQSQNIGFVQMSLFACEHLPFALLRIFLLFSSSLKFVALHLLQKFTVFFSSSSSFCLLIFISLLLNGCIYVCVCVLLCVHVIKLIWTMFSLSFVCFSILFFFFSQFTQNLLFSFFLGFSFVIFFFLLPFYLVWISEKHIVKIKI